MECSTISASNVTFDTQSQLIEELEQQVYQTNHQLENRNLIINEMEIENEKLQAMVDYNENNWKIEKRELTKQFNEKINSLQCLLEEEREKAKNKISDLVNKIDSVKPNKTILKEEIPIEYDLLKDQVLSLKGEVEELKDQLAECKSMNHNSELANSQLVEKSKELEKELEVTTEFLKMKTDSLQSTLETFEELKEEKALLTSELAILKAGPLENKERGNSLFSEVDIRRQAIEKKMDMLRSKYLQAKKVLALKHNEMERLKAENRRIQMFWDEEESRVRQRELKLLETYKQTNNELRSLIDKLELRPESPEIITISDRDMSNMQWIHIVIDKARTEAREYRKAYVNKSSEILLVENNLYSMSVEIKNLKKQAIRDKALIEELQSKLATSENPDNTINPTEQRADQEKKDEGKLQIVNGGFSSKTVRFADD